MRIQRGFTLIELLVALVILGIAVALVTVNLAQGEDRALRAEAERLSLLLQQARDEAMIRGHRIVFSASSPGYRFLESQTDPDSLGNPSLREMQSPPFQARSLPTGMRLGSRQTDPPAEARIVFSPSGLLLPFRLELANAAQTLAVTGLASGAIRMETTP